MTTLVERAQARNGRIGPRARAERREAIALVAAGPREVLDAADAVVPPGSRLAAAAHDARMGYARGIALAVAGGWDTDSAGATVGSVLGALVGADGIDPAWTAPLRGRIATSLPPSALPSSKRRGGAAGERSIEELAERTAALPERITQ